MPVDDRGNTFTYDWGSADQRASFAKALEIDLEKLTANDLHLLLGRIMNGQNGNSLDHPAMAGEGDRMVCPIAYRLARDVGLDPAGFLLLEELHCYVTIHTPSWRRKLRFATHDGGLEMQGPLADGLVWRGGWPGPRGIVLASCLFIDTDVHPIPETIRNALEGRRLSDVVAHPLLDGDMVILSISDDEDLQDQPLELRFTTNPPLVRLADAARSYG